MSTLHKCLIVILVFFTFTLIGVFGTDYDDYQKNVDLKIITLEEQNRELKKDLISIRRQCDDLIRYHQNTIEQLNEELLKEENDDKAQQIQVEIGINEIYLQLLTSFHESGLSRTTYPDLMIQEQLPLWLQELGRSGTLAWSKGGGLDELSILAGIYYKQKHIANNNMIIELLKTNREYGMSKEEYDRYKREWKLLSTPKAGIKPYNEYSEGTGLIDKGIYAYPLYVLVKIYRVASIPEPGSEEYWDLLTKSLYCLERKGVDIISIMEHHDSLSTRIRSLKPAEAQPGFFESIGFLGETDPKDIADITQWRTQLLKTSYKHLLRLARTCDQESLVIGLRRQAEGLHSFDEALALSADAVVTEIEANQKLTEDILSEIPAVGDAMSLYSVFTGETLSGEQVSGWTRIIDAIMSFSPIGLEGAMRASPSLTRMVNSLQLTLRNASSTQLKKLSHVLNIPIERLEEVSQFIVGVFG